MHTLYPGNAFGDDDSFMHSLVREPGRPDEVANGINPGDAGLTPFVHRNMRFLDLDPRIFKADIFDIADDTDSEDRALRRQCFRFSVFCLSVALTSLARFSSFSTTVDG